MIKRVTVPKGYYRIVPEKVNRTRFVQSQRTGLLGGRRLAPVKQSDRTNVIRLVKPYDINHNGRIDNSDLRSGQIIGRSRSRVKPRQMIIKRFYRKGRPVRMHNRRFT